MKRGIPIALQAAGVLLACLVTTLNCRPHIAEARPFPGHEIGYYYNENGQLIYCDTMATKAGTYVIKTCQTKDALFYDYYRRNNNRRDGDAILAEVKDITVEEADTVARLIKRGHVLDKRVRDNIIAIVDRGVLVKIWKRIPDSGESTDPVTDFREYGGYIKEDKTFTFDPGDSMDVCKGYADVIIDTYGNGLGFYHSHPSGESQNKKCGFTQAPSRIDQDSTDKGVGYVFGMNKSSHLLYVYNKDGILATLPFCWFLCDAVIK